MLADIIYRSLITVWDYLGETRVKSPNEYIPGHPKLCSEDLDMKRSCQGSI